MTTDPNWQLVPKEPTEEMHGAANREWDGRMSARSRGVWKAMLAAAPTPPQSNWQSIDSAPKDGTHVLVALDEIVGEAQYYIEDGREHEGWYWNDQHWTDAVGGEPFQPTHWMPLPPPPALNGDK